MNFTNNQRASRRVCRCLATRSSQRWCQIRRLSGHSCLRFSGKWPLNRSTSWLRAVAIVSFSSAASSCPSGLTSGRFLQTRLVFGGTPVQNHCITPFREYFETAIRNIHFVPSRLPTLTSPTLLENNSEQTLTPPFLLSSVTFYLPTRNANNSSACKILEFNKTAAHFNFYDFWFITSRFEWGFF